MKILPAREEVNANKPDNHGQTPLLLATKNGRERVVSLLQSRIAVAPSTI